MIGFMSGLFNPPDAEILLRTSQKRFEEPPEEEECEHRETECGHCIDCGKYFNKRAEAYNFSDSDD